MRPRIRMLPTLRQAGLALLTVVLVLVFTAAVTFGALGVEELIRGVL